MFCVEFNPPGDVQLGRNMLQTEHTHSYGLRSVSQLTTYGRLAMGWTVGGSNPGEGYRVSLFLNRPDRLYDPPSLLFNNYRGSIAGGTMAGV
jgi:hypothetical protein